MFVVEIGGELRKCRCEGVRHLAAALKYACKGGKHHCNIKNFHEGVLIPTILVVRRMAKREGRQKTLEFYADAYPEESMKGKNLANVDRYLQRLDELESNSVAEKEREMVTPFRLRQVKISASILPLGNMFNI